MGICNFAYNFLLRQHWEIKLSKIERKEKNWSISWFTFSNDDVKREQKYKMNFVKQTCYKLVKHVKQWTDYKITSEKRATGRKIAVYSFVDRRRSAGY